MVGLKLRVARAENFLVGDQDPQGKADIGVFPRGPGQNFPLLVGKFLTNFAN